MTAWDILTAHSANLGNAWFRLNNATSTTVVLNNDKASGFTADNTLLFDVTPLEVILDMTNTEIVFSTEPTIILMSTSPDEYQFDITIPVVNLEA